MMVYRTNNCHDIHDILTHKYWVSPSDRETLLTRHHDTPVTW